MSITPCEKSHSSFIPYSLKVKRETS